MGCTSVFGLRFSLFSFSRKKRTETKLIPDNIKNAYASAQNADQTSYVAFQIDGLQEKQQHMQWEKLFPGLRASNIWDPM